MTPLTDPAQLKAPKRKRLDSVSSVLDAVLPKGGLTFWVERETVKGVLQMVRAGELVEQMTEDEVLASMREYKIGAQGTRDTAARRGINVHALLEAYAKTGLLPDPVGTIDVDDYGYVVALNRWLMEHQPEPLEIEQLVADPAANYAGRLDLIANISGQRTLVDLKTSERGQVFDRAHAQCRLYHRASIRCGSEPCDRLMVVVVAKDGRYREMDCLMTDRGMDAALNWRRALKPVTGACNTANHAEKEARAEPKANQPGPPPWEADHKHPDPAHRPGAWKDYKRRELPDGSIIEFESAPAGWTTKDGKRRQKDWRAYYVTPPVQAELPVARAA